VYVNVPKEKIKESPEYDFSSALSKEDEEILYNYYERPYYWNE